MSIYRHLSTPIPTIAYCALHQAHNHMRAEEYTKTMRELHNRIGEESEQISAGYTKALHELTARESQMLSLSLSQFLHTPVSTDQKEVNRVIDEALARFRTQVLENDAFGLKRSVEGKVYFPPSKKAVEKKLLHSGKSYLEGLGFGFGKGRGEIFESMFVIEGGTNLDILEHIVRDRLGIYATTHGKHIKEFSGYSYAAYNLIYANGEIPPAATVKSFTEVAFFFAKNDMKYAPFRAGLTEAFDKLSREQAIDHISLWQRKLGLGRGEEFVLRIMCDSAEKISISIQWLSNYREKFVSEVLTSNAKLLVKELLF